MQPVATHDVLFLQNGLKMGAEALRVLLMQEHCVLCGTQNQSSRVN